MSALAHRIEPFRGLVYNPGKVLDLADVVAPPYDLIGPERQQQLYDRSPFNVVRLELNREADPYSAAATMLSRWIADGVCHRSPSPSIYLYSQVFEVVGVRLRREGLIARIRLEEFSKGRILPHERTFAAAKEDRLRLLTATRTNLSSIFGLYAGRHPELEALKKNALQQPPMIRVTDDLRIDNELRVIEKPEQIATVQKALAECRVLIADGHHRYETALNYRRIRRDAEGNPAEAQPYDYTMMTLTSCEDPGLVILPTHRIVGELRDDPSRDFDQRSASVFDIVKVSSGAELQEQLARAGNGAIAVVLRSDRQFRLLKLKNRSSVADAMPSLPDPVRQLDVSILHAMILDRLLGVKEQEVRKGGNVAYTIDANSAIQSVLDNRAAGAFLLNPPTISDVERVSDAGATMPEKSTYFYPKLLTGLVMNPLDG